MYPSTELVKTITADRLAEAEAGRRAARAQPRQPSSARQSRRLHRLALRLAGATPR